MGTCHFCGKETDVTPRKLLDYGNSGAKIVTMDTCDRCAKRKDVDWVKDTKRIDYIVRYFKHGKLVKTRHFGCDYGLAWGASYTWDELGAEFTSEIDSEVY